MFERYTEKARRVIFFARYEASQLRASAIDTEHILLGILRDEKALVQRLFRSPVAEVEAIRRQIEGSVVKGDRIPASIDLPLSQSARQVLNFAAEASDRLQHRFIGTEHLLLGVLKEETSLASQVLTERGLTVDTIIACLNEKIGVSQEAVEGSQPEVGKGVPGGIVGGIAGGISKNFSSFEEFAAAVADKGGLADLLEQYHRLVELLAQKGVLTDEEVNELKKKKS